MKTFNFYRNNNSIEIKLIGTRLEVTVNGKNLGRVLARKNINGVGDAIVLNDKVMIAVGDQKELIDSAFAAKEEAMEDAVKNYKMTDSDREIYEYYHSRDVIEHAMNFGEPKD